ncbi:MAG: hypothetical protein HY738_23010 [Bacteroidia bacterium]|nr:hypothetical protein [Bacteroidia bacterium]
MNEVFFDYQKLSNENRKTEASLKERLAYNRENSDSTAIINKLLEQNDFNIAAIK